MDFTLPPEIDAIRLRTRAFVDSEIIPLESDPASYDAHENIALPLLERVRAKAMAEGLWAPQTPREFGGLGIGLMGQAACMRRQTAPSSGRPASMPPRPTTAT